MNQTATQANADAEYECSLMILMAAENFKQDFVAALVRAKAHTWEAPFCHLSLTASENYLLQTLTDNVARARMGYINRLKRLTAENEDAYAR